MKNRFNLMASVAAFAFCLIIPAAANAQQAELVGPTKPVVVTNTTANPVPVTGQIDISNMPIVDARQSGPWSVGITGTPTVKIDPNSTVKIDPNTPVRVAPSGTTVLFDTNQISIAADAPRIQTFGPIDIADYSKVRVVVTRFSGVGLSTEAIDVMPSTKVLSGTVPIDFFPAENTATKVYEAAGTELSVTLFFKPGAYVTQVVVFGS